MAYLLEDENLKDDEQRAQAEDPTLSSGNQASPSGGGSGAPADTGNTSGGAGAGRSGQRTFQGIKQYLQQNQPATQRLASNVSGKVAEYGDTAKKTLQEQSGAFGTRVQEGSASADQSLLDQIMSSPETADAARVKALRDAQYSGPTAFESSAEYEPVAAAFNKATRARDQLATSGGRQELLASLVPNNQRLSRGRLALDEALVASDPNARGVLESARLGQKGLEEDFSAGRESAAKQIVEAQAGTLAARDSVRGALGQSRETFQTGLDERLAAARAEAAQRAEAVRKLLNPGTHLALGPGGTITDFSDQPLTAARGGAEATDEQIARTGMSREQLAAALRDLSYSGPGNVHRQGGGRQLYIPAAGTEDVTDQALADLGISRDVYDIIRGGEVEKIINANRAKGLTGDQVKRLLAQYDRSLGDPSRYLTTLSPDAEITRANLATEQDYARQAALNDLIGESDQFLRAEDAGLAGTADLDLSKLDANALRASAMDSIMRALGESGRVSAFNARDSSSGTLLQKVAPKLASFVGLGPIGSVAAPALGGSDLIDSLTGGRGSSKGKGLKLTPAQRAAIAKELE